MPAGNCVISSTNEDAEGEHGVSCSAAEWEGAGMRSSAAAMGAAFLSLPLQAFTAGPWCQDNTQS